MDYPKSMMAENGIKWATDQVQATFGWTPEQCAADPHRALVLANFAAMYVRSMK